MGANATDANYYLYYANPAAGAPPANQSNVYLFTDGLEAGSTANWTQQAGGAGGWYNNSWTKRKPITLTAGQISGSHTDFPVLISITDANLASGAQADGDDILFTDGNGTTRLDHQIESWNSATGALVAWVRKPTLAAASNTMYLYYGYAAATALPATGVWSGDYKGVWHLNQTPSAAADDLPDATANGNNGTSRGTMAAPVTGKIGNALTFDGSDDYINTTNGLTNPQVFTTQAWVKTSSASGKVVVGFESGKTGTGSSNYDRTLFLDTTGKAGVGVYDGSADRAARGGSVANNAWHLVVGTFDTATDTLAIYVDGSLMTVVTATTAENYTGYLRIGSYKTDHSSTSAGYFPGQVDEVRFSTNAHSAGWVSTEYNNQNNPGGFHTLGSQENVPVSTDFTAATDQAHSGTYSLKAAAGTGVTRWLVANGLDYADVRVDAWWRLSTTTNVTVSQGVRAGSGGSVNQYEGTLNTTPRWTTTKEINGTATTVFTAAADATCPTANTWAKVSVEITGTQWRTFCNDTQAAPAAGFSTTGGELTTGSVGFRVANIPVGQNWWVDDVVVRRFVNPEPTSALGTVDRP